MHQKKAQASYMKVVLIAIAFLVILLPFVWKIGEQAAEVSRITSCKASVEANAQMHISALDFSKNIKCPTKEITIKTKDQNKIKKQLADEMAECWDIYKQGEENLFSKNGMLCAICSRIDFKDKNAEVKGFSKFLTETKMPRLDKTYLEYLARYSTEEAYELLGKLETSNYNLDEESFPTNKDYMVIFVYAKGTDAIKKLSNFLTAENIGGKVGMVALGAGAVGAGLAVFGIVSNPVGWGIGIAGIIVAVGSYFLEPENAPEWSSVTVFTEYTEERLTEIGCEYLPVEQS